MSKPRDTCKYYVKIGNKIVHGGITSDLDRREQEHKQKWPNGHIFKVGRKPLLMTVNIAPEASVWKSDTPGWMWRDEPPTSSSHQTPASESSPEEQFGRTFAVALQNGEIESHVSSSTELKGLQRAEILQGGGKFFLEAMLFLDVRVIFPDRSGRQVDHASSAGRFQCLRSSAVLLPSPASDGLRSLPDESIEMSR